MNNKVVISSSENFKELKKKIISGGVNNFHVLADFDRTLTKAFVNGEKTPSVISVLRDEDFLSEEYSEKAKALFAKYHPIEINPKISVDDKRKAMYEWWTNHFDLLISSGLNKKHLERVINEGKIQFREGTLEFLDFLNEKDIPLVIISSAGLGGDFISMFLEKHNRMYENIHIVSNSYEWDESGKAVGIKVPIIHSMNKDETILKEIPNVYNIVKDRKNVLLLGDSLGDLGMIEGFDYDNLMKIGFLNDKIDENLELYNKSYDAVILNDGDFGFVNEFVRRLK